MQLPNLFAGLPDKLAQEFFDPLFTGRKFRLERIISTGQTTPDGEWYDQDEAEWVLLLAGEAELEFENNALRVRLRPGDQLLIPAHDRHRVIFTSPTEPTLWLALFFQP